MCVHVSGMVYEQSGATGDTCTTQTTYAPQTPCPQGYWMPNAPVHNLPAYVAPMPQMNNAQTYVTQSHNIPAPQPMTGHDGIVTARSSPGLLRPTPYYDHPIAYVAPQMMVPAQAMVPLTYMPANGTVPTNVVAMPWKPYTVMMPVGRPQDDVACYGSTGTIAVSPCQHKLVSLAVL